MRVANCKNVCREIDESTVGQDLSRSAKEHVQGCVRCQAFYDGRRKLRLMLASLETVEAPPDFDFRVRSQLANKKAGAHAEFFFGSHSFRVPAVAMATLVLLLGLGLALRSVMTRNSPIAVRTDTPAENKSDALPVKQTTAAPGKQEVASDNKARQQDRPERDARRRKGALRNAVASQRTGGRLATREFSSMAASVVKQDEAIASLETSPIFAVDASSEPLKVSLDYDTGVSRTISLPTLSFGSERALTGGASSLVKTSAKGVW